MHQENIMIEKSVTFSIEIIRFCEILDAQRKYVVSQQLLKSGTSIGVNIFEAQHSESRANFIHKMKIAIKEASETVYWLIICDRSESYPSNSSLKTLAEELIRILAKIIISGKRG